MLWSALLRASADVALFAYLPVHLHADLGERRLLVIALAPALAHALRSLGAPLWGTLADGAGRQRPFLAAGLLGYGAALAALSVVGSPRLAVLAVAAAAVPASALNPVAKGWLTLQAVARPSSRSRSEPLRPLAAWYRWEAAGYLAGGLGLAAAAARPWGPGLLLQGEAIALGLAAAVVAVAVHDLPPLTVSPGRTAGADPPLVGAAIFCFAASALWETVALVFGIYWTEHLGGSVSGYGLIISSSTLAGIAAYWPLTAWGPRLGPNGLFRLAAAGYAGSFLSMSAAWAPAAAVAYAVPVSAALHAGAGLAAAEGTGAAARNRGMGVVEAAEALGACVGSLAGGLTADALGPVWVPRLAALAALGLLPLSAVAGQRRPPV